MSFTTVAFFVFLLAGIVVYYVLPAVKGAVLCLALVAAYITVKED